jgi:hypothetical protein
MWAGRSIFAALVAAALLAAAPAAAEVHVTSSADSGVGSLRAAIEGAPPGETVVIDPGVDPTLSTEIKIDKSLTVRGQGAGATTIGGGGVTRAFNVGSAVPGIGVRIEALTIAEGRAPDGANGAPEVFPAIFADPGFPGGDGGAIRNAATQLRLVGVALRANVAGTGGTGGTAFEHQPGWGGDGGNGGAVSNSGTLTIEGSTLSGNRAGLGGAPGTGGTGPAFAGAAGRGGAVANTGALTIVNSTLVNNKAADGTIGGTISETGLPGRGGGAGGAILSTGGTLVVLRSTLSGNVAGAGGGGGFGAAFGGEGGDGGAGGAITVTEGVAKVIDSTLTLNSAGAGGPGASSPSNGGAGGNGGSGGAIAVSGGTVTVAAATLSANAAGPRGAGGSGSPTGLDGAPGSGGGVSGALTVRGSILAGNSGTSANCAGGVVDGGGNIAFPEAGGCVGPTVADPKLDPAGLASNGGPTQTIALLTGSAAIDAVPTANCLDASGASLTADQRGISRPQGAACDAGAFEVAVPTTHVDPGVTVPDTRIAGKAKRKVRTAKKRARVKVAFSSIPAGAGFECKLDRGRFRRCSSPKTYRLERGRYTIEVRAVLNGVADPTPARVKIRVIRLTPDGRSAH